MFKILINLTYFYKVATYFPFGEWVVLLPYQKEVFFFNYMFIGVYTTNLKSVCESVSGF